MIRKSLSSELLYRYGQMRCSWPRLFPKPLGFYFYITGRCNLNCTYCWQREQAERTGEWHNSMIGELDPDEWKEIVRKLPRCGFLGLSGGEVTVSKTFPVIMEEAARKNLSVTVNTNGRFLSDQHLDLLTMKNVRNVSISLDGFADVHDKSRSMPGLFDGIIANIKRFNERRLKNHRPSLTIKTVLLDENVDQLLEFRKFCEQELKADTLNVSFMKGGDHAQFSLLYGDELRKIFDERKAFLHPYKNPNQIGDVLEKLLKGNATSRCEVEIFPRMKTAAQVRDFLQKQGEGVYESCFLPWSMVVVLPNGEVVPCLSLGLGNVRKFEYDVRLILKQDKYRSFLEKITSCSRKTPQACNVCCFLKTK